jgi:excisionase family DNA binding protein
MGGTPMSDQRLTVEQVASQLHVADYTVRAWAKAGILRGSKPGKRWLFDQADVDALLEAAENRPRETPRRRRRRAA